MTKNGIFQMQQYKGMDLSILLVLLGNYIYYTLPCIWRFSITCRP